MTNDVAILGGGFMGVCAALECARRGITVDLYDRRTELLSEAARVNEGKIHGGYVYANDPTLRTARRLAEGAVLFDRCLSRWIDLQAQPLEVSQPFDYAVLRQSALPASAIESHFRQVDRILGETERQHGARYLNRSSDEGFEPLPHADVARQYDPAHVAAVYRTTERSVDAWRLAERLRDAVRSSPAIRVHTGTTVVNVGRDGDAKFFVTLRSAEHETRERYGCIVNALWGGRLAIDAGLGLLPGRQWLYRYKFGLRMSLRRETFRPPTVTLVHGAFGDAVNFSTGLTYMSWYPAGMVGTSDAVVPPDWGGTFNDPERLAIAVASIRALGRCLNALRDLPDADITSCHVDGAVIFAWGHTDIDDPGSELHQRHDIGIHTDRTYHSVDPGKYTMVPMLAVELGERVARSG